ncbi:MAG: XrtA-associated tyrosine autokinase [Porticoccaceae bacterium]
MSTIEKAVEKLGKSPAQPNQVRGAVAPDLEKGSDQSLSPEQVSPYSVESALQSDIPVKVDLELPFARLEEMGFVTPANPRSRIAEEYRAIKRPLLKNIDGQLAEDVPNINLIMVSSSYEGEGKTFSAINLMMSVSMEKDKTVLFVDSDIVKASAGKLLGIPNDAPGLIDLLENEQLGVEEVLLTTSLPNLRIIPAGKAHDHCNELFASERMKQLMAELSLRYPDRVIIFDAPPFLQTNEASVLASFMGQIMFVVEAEKTPPDMVKQATSQFGRDKIVGLVLNKARNYPWDNYTQGYGYGYGYGSDRSALGGSQDA